MRVLRRPFEMIWEGTVSASSSVKALAIRIYRLVIKPNPQLIQRQNIARLNKKIQQLKPEEGPPAKRRPMQQAALPGQPATETPTVSDQLKKYFSGGHAEFETALKDLVHATIERRVHSQIKDYPLARLSDNEVVKLLKVPTLKLMVQEKNTDSLTKFRDHLQKHFDLIRKLSAAGGSFPPEEVRRDLPLLLQGQTHEEVKQLVKEEFDAFGLTGDLDTHLTALFTNTYTHTDENVLSTLLLILLKKRLEQMLDNVETLTTGDWKALVKERIDSVTDYLCLLIGKRVEQLIDRIELGPCVNDTLKLAAEDVEQRGDYLPKLVESYRTLCSASGYTIQEGSVEEKKEHLLLLLETEELKPELALHLSLFAMTVKRDKQTKERFFRLLANHLLNQLIAQETPDGSFYSKLLEPKSDALQLFTYEALRLLLPKEAYTAKTLFTHITSGLLPKALQERLKALEEGNPLYRAIDIAGRGLIAKQLAKGLEKGFDKMTEPHKLKKVLATELLHKGNQSLKFLLMKQLIKTESKQFLPLFFNNDKEKFKILLQERFNHHEWTFLEVSDPVVESLWKHLEENGDILFKILLLNEGKPKEGFEKLKQTFPQFNEKKLETFFAESQRKMDHKKWYEELDGKFSWSLEKCPTKPLVEELLSFSGFKQNGWLLQIAFPILSRFLANFLDGLVDDYRRKETIYTLATNALKKQNNVEQSYFNSQDKKDYDKEREELKERLKLLRKQAPATPYRQEQINVVNQLLDKELPKQHQRRYKNDHESPLPDWKTYRMDKMQAYQIRIDTLKKQAENYDPSLVISEVARVGPNLDTICSEQITLLTQCLFALINLKSPVDLERALTKKQFEQNLHNIISLTAMQAENQHLLGHTLIHIATHHLSRAL